MFLKDSLRIALHSMHTGRLRTVLTMLGIILSAAIVIMTSALGAGLENGYRIAGKTNYATIAVSTLPAQPTAGGSGSRDLRDSDVEALARESDPAVISDIAPIVTGSVMVRHGPKQFRGSIVGSTAAYLRVQSSAVSLAAGSVFTDEQYKNRARVILLAPVLVKALFNGDPNAAIGSTVDIGKLRFQVIGILGPAVTNSALMPMTTARAFLFGGVRTVGSIDVLTTSAASINPAIEQINGILGRQHFIRDPSLRDFIALPQNPTNSLVVQFIDLLHWFSVGVTGIAFFIGALGLANIMLITVTERTGEIGLRRAVGARRGAILRQFLFESVLIAGLGGIMGVFVGAASTTAASRILPRVAPVYGVPQMSVEIIACAFGLSLLVGLVAGCYPALRASRLQPWDALRY